MQEYLLVLPDDEFERFLEQAQYSVVMLQSVLTKVAEKESIAPDILEQHLIDAIALEEDPHGGTPDHCLDTVSHVGHYAITTVLRDYLERIGKDVPI